MIAATSYKLYTQIFHSIMFHKLSGASEIYARERNFSFSRRICLREAIFARVYVFRRSPPKLETTRNLIRLSKIVSNVEIYVQCFLKGYYWKFVEAMGLSTRSLVTIVNSMQLKNYIKIKQIGQIVGRNVSP